MEELSEEQKKAMSAISHHLNELARCLEGEPIDPKVEALLRITADCLHEQVIHEKYYEWPVIEESNNLTNTKLEDVNIPTEDELREWFGNMSKD